MADDADRANDYIDAAMLRFARRQAQSAIRPNHLSTECTDCGDEIEAERIKIFPHATRCVECQGYYERSRTHD